MTVDVVTEIVIDRPVDQVARYAADPSAGLLDEFWATPLAHHFGRLRSAAEGDPPGADPFADRRVPTPEELARP